MSLQASSSHIAEDLLSTIRSRHVFTSVRTLLLNLLIIGGSSLFILVCLRYLFAINSYLTIMLSLLPALYGIWLTLNFKKFRVNEACTLLDKNGNLQDRMISWHLLQTEEPHSARFSIVQKQINELAQTINLTSITLFL